MVNDAREKARMKKERIANRTPALRSSTKSRMMGSISSAVTAIFSSTAPSWKILCSLDDSTPTHGSQITVDCQTSPQAKASVVLAGYVEAGDVEKPAISKPAEATEKVAQDLDGSLDVLGHTTSLGRVSGLSTSAIAGERSRSVDELSMTVNHDYW
ncbi:MAG: hypothetical protein Q9182_002767 [Xanthomendoza sp. 2 TL-2023]